MMSCPGPFHGFHVICFQPSVVGARCIPDGDVQSGGVLVHHVLHLVPRGPPPILNEQLLGLTVILYVPVCPGQHDRARRTKLHLKCLGVVQESIKLQKE